MSTVVDSYQGKPFHADLVRVKGLFAFSLPLGLLASASSFILFINSLFLAHISPEELQKQTIGFALVALFQIACIRMSTEAQVFISQACSSHKYQKVGVYLWQMIWLSLMSILVTLPISYFAAEVYFTKSAFQQEAKSYCQILMYGNFLYPLSAALSAFFSGRGKINTLIVCTIINLLFHVPLAYVTINWMGLKGAAISQIITQAFFCVLLFCIIFQKKYRSRFGTNLWRLRLKPFLASIRIGAFNGFSAAILSLSWTVIVKIVSNTGSDPFLTVLAFGECLGVLTFFYIGLGQAISISASGMIGAKQFDKIWTLVRSSTLVILLTLILLLFPLVLYPDFLIELFFPDFRQAFSPELINVLRFSCKILWLHHMIAGFDRMARSLLTATGDTIYMFKTYLIFMSLGTCLPIYLMVHVWQCSADYFWLAITVTIFLRNIPLVFRIRKELLNPNYTLVV